MKKKLLIGALFVALLAIFWLPGLAAATLVDLKDMGVNPSVTANVTFPGYAGISVYAGNANLDIRNPASSSNPYVHFDAYCVEAQPSSGSSQVYSLQGISKNTAYNGAAYLLSLGYNHDSSQAPEIQVAIWELVIDWQAGNSYDLAGGNFKFNSGSGIDTALVATHYSAALAHLGTFDASGFVIASNDTYQAFVTKNPVPIPSTLLLLGTGLVGFVGLRPWKRKQQK